MRRRGREFKSMNEGRSSDRDHQRYWQYLKKCAKYLWNDASHSRDHGDFARSRDPLEQINNQLTRDCGK
jgi:hypothetical protein